VTAILPGGIGQLFGGVAYSAWDPTTVWVTSPPATFTNNNRTITASTGITTSGIPNDVRGKKSHNAGRFYFETKIADVSTAQSVGLVTPAWVASGNYPGMGTNDAGLVAAGSQYTVYSGGNASTQFLLTSAAGDVVAAAVDWVINAGYASIYFRVNATWGGGGAGNTTTFPPLYPDVLLSTTALFPATGCGSSAAGGNTINTGNAAFAYAPPSGFVAWG
jgi:hypothetical protein